ncbi:MAG: SRPBCC family protein [Bacteroidales bacterium]|nr:SRPBCC family protein [Bacteroidales bacterium]MBN2756133.1 SRPBCC family protein [Bacteroidales bacterium]
MKAFKRIIMIIAAFLLAGLLFAAIAPKKFSVEKQVTINKPKQEVFDYIKQLKNQDNYSVWAKIDPKMEKSYKGLDGAVGFVSAWNSNNKDVGKGEQEIIKIDEGKRIDYQLRFFEPYESISPAYMTTEENEPDKTTVKWGIEGEMPYPMNITLIFMDMDKAIGNDLTKGLENLKLELEK